MTSFLSRDEYTGVRIEMGLAAHDSHDHALIQAVAQATAVENMRRVSAEEIQLGSHATYYAFLGEGESTEFVGFLRQRAEQHRVTAGGTMFTLNELGTLWVRPEHRKHGVAHKLVANASEQVAATLGSDGEISLPFGVCNEQGIRIFGDAGHHIIGANSTRTFMLRPPEDAGQLAVWQGGLHQEIIPQLADIPRFAGMTALAQAA